MQRSLTSLAERTHVPKHANCYIFLYLELIWSITRSWFRSHLGECDSYPVRQLLTNPMCGKIQFLNLMDIMFVEESLEDGPVWMLKVCRRFQIQMLELWKIFNVVIERTSASDKMLNGASKGSNNTDHTRLCFELIFCKLVLPLYCQLCVQSHNGQSSSRLDIWQKAFDTKTHGMHWLNFNHWSFQW